MTETLNRSTALDAWVRCGKCDDLVYGKRMARNLRVCPECGWHSRLTAPQRIDQLMDRGSVELLERVTAAAGDPLGFVDTKPYARRLADARAATGLDEAVVCVRATIEGHAVVAAVMDFHFLGGSLGSAVGEMITRAAESALATRTPLLIITASGGARMQEGAISLMQMAKTSDALGELDRAGILTVSLISDPTYGGVAASYTMLCDIIIAEPGARLGFAGPRVIEQTIRARLPEGFQTAEFLLEHGMVDMVCARQSLRSELARVLSAGSGGSGTLPAADGPDPRVTDPGSLPERSSWPVVRAARALERPTAKDYFSRILDDFQELHGDRLSSDCPAIVGGLGWLDGTPLVAIGHQKGHTVAELSARNFGMATPAGYRKTARLMRLAEKLRLPVLTLIDTPGAYPGRTAEEQGQAVAIADNLRLMAGLPVPVVSVVTGEGGSGGALALAVANQVLMLSEAVYSVISPEGCAAILWQDPAAAPQAAEALRVEARALLELGVVDAVIPEPDGGSQNDYQLAAQLLRSAVTAALSELTGMEPAKLVEQRRQRFRAL